MQLTSKPCWGRRYCLAISAAQKLLNSHLEQKGHMRFRVLIGNNGAVHFSAYPEPYNHAHLLHVYFWHNLGTIHTIWVFLDWILSQSVNCYIKSDSTVHNVIVFNSFFVGGGKLFPRAHPVNNFWHNDSADITCASRASAPVSAVRV